MLWEFENVSNYGEETLELRLAAQVIRTGKPTQNESLSRLSSGFVEYGGHELQPHCVLSPTHLRNPEMVDLPLVLSDSGLPDNRYLMLEG